MTWEKEYLDCFRKVESEEFQQHIREKIKELKKYEKTLKKQYEIIKPTLKYPYNQYEFYEFVRAFCPILTTDEIIKYYYEKLGIVEDYTTPKEYLINICKENFHHIQQVEENKYLIIT